MSQTNRMMLFRMYRLNHYGTGPFRDALEMRNLPCVEMNTVGRDIVFEPRRGLRK
jgi:hypothetical protein